MSKAAAASAPKGRPTASTRSRSTDSAEPRSRAALASPSATGPSRDLLTPAAAAASRVSAPAPSTPSSQGAHAVMGGGSGLASSSSAASPLAPQRSADLATRLRGDRDGRLLSELIDALVFEDSGKLAIADSAFEDWHTEDVKDLALHFRLAVDRSALSSSRVRASLRKWVLDSAKRHEAEAARLAQEKQARLAARIPAASSDDEDSPPSASDVDSEPVRGRARRAQPVRSRSASPSLSQSASSRRALSSASLKQKDVAALLAALDRRARHPMEPAPSARHKGDKGSGAASSRSHADARRLPRPRSSSSSSDESYAPPVRSRRFASPLASDSESSGDEGGAFDVDRYADGMRDVTRSRYSERSRREEVDDEMAAQRPMAQRFIRRALAQGDAKSLLQVFTARAWKNDRNKNECLTLARALDHLHRAKPRVAEAVELLCRRLAGVDIADESGNWAFCQALEGSSSQHRQSLVPEDIMRGALKSVAQLQAIHKTAAATTGSKSASGAKGHSGGGRGASRSTYKKDGAGGGQGKRDSAKPSNSSGPSAK